MNETVVYLNGGFMPRPQATLDLEDRGSLFADGVYEVLRYYAGRPLAVNDHIERLKRSLAGIELPLFPEVDQFAEVGEELLARNGLTEAKVYWQISRGAAPRNHEFPRGVRPTVLAIAYPEKPLDPTAAPRVVAAITHPDERWTQCWIKSLMLLPNVLARNRAKRAGAAEAILHRDGIVTEGSATSVCAVRSGEVWTHPADQWILPGVTRKIVLELARRLGITVREQIFNVDQLRTADEAAILGTTTHVAAVTTLDGRPIGDGQIGKITQRLHEALVKHILTTCGSPTRC